MTFTLTLVTSFYLFIGIVYFSLKRKDYRGLRQTISELGEDGAQNARLVNFLLFLPVGLAMFSVAVLSDELIVQGLASCIGAGYTVAAFFPCDPGSPLDGSWKQQIHNLGGFAEYVGSIYFLKEASFPLSFIDGSYLLIALIVCTVLISIPPFPLRGLIQRIAELVLFGSLLALTW